MDSFDLMVGLNVEESRHSIHVCLFLLKFRQLSPRLQRSTLFPR